MMTKLIELIDESLPGSTDEVAIEQATLDALFTQLLGEDFATSQATFYTDAVLRRLGHDPTELQARSGGWTFHVSRSLAQSAVSGVVMALLLKTVATAPISLAIIPAILPYLFQIEKTQITMRDEKVLLHLHRIVVNQRKTADELYDSLPQDIRDQVNRLDFLEFLDSMTKTGHARRIARGVFQLRHPDYPRFVLNFV